MSKIQNLWQPFTLLLLPFLIVGCYSSKELAYLQGGGFTKEYPTAFENKRPVYRLQPSDILYVDIQNLEAEPNLNEPHGNAMASDLTMIHLQGYTIDPKGYVNVPLLGKVEVANLTVDEASTLLLNEAKNYIRSVSVKVKLLSFKISVMGEVQSPGQFDIYTGQTSVLQALSMAGDITREGNRKSIKLIRQNEEGVEVIRMDITDTDILESKYFYLLPNDVLYVEPSQVSLKRANLLPLGITLGALSVAVLISSFLFNHVL